MDKIHWPNFFAPSLEEIPPLIAPIPPEIAPIPPLPSGEIAPEIAPPDTSQIEPPIKKRERRPPDTLKKAVLEELDTYYPYLARMRRVDPMAYALYRQVGAQLWCGEERLTDISELEPWWKENRPSFGSIAVSHERLVAEKDKVYPKFWYFRKYKEPPCWVQHLRGGDIYEMTAYFDDTKIMKKSGGTITVHVLVTADCKVIALKTLATRYIENRTGSIPQRGWELSDVLKIWAHENGESSPEQYAAFLFHLIGNAYADLSHSIIQIRATKRKVAALFSVDVIKTPQFFADRETVSGVNAAGEVYTKKIFHIVRTHVRASGSGVKAHFRGLRKFTWNDYAIEISVPYREHFNLVEFEPGLCEMDAEEAATAGIQEGMLGRLLEQKRRDEIDHHSGSTIHAAKIREREESGGFQYSGTPQRPPVCPDQSQVRQGEG